MQSLPREKRNKKALSEFLLLLKGVISTTVTEIPVPGHRVFLHSDVQHVTDKRKHASDLGAENLQMRPGHRKQMPGLLKRQDPPSDQWSTWVFISPHANVSDF